MTSLPDHRFVALAAGAVLLAGCGVLTIDVDVYKGPLVNDEAVQVEQVAVIVVGAKPLLIQLRDRLEAKHRYGDAKDGVQKVRAELRKKYKLDSTFDFIEEGETRFKDDRAIQVNAVLSLYKDQGSARLSLSLGGLARAADDYEAAYWAFTRTPLEDASFVEELKLKSIPVAADAPKPADVTYCRARVSGTEFTVDQLVTTLREGYKELHMPDSSSGRSVGAIHVVSIHRCLLLRQKEVISALSRTWPGLSVPRVPDPMVAGKPLSEYGDRELARMFGSQETAYAFLGAEGMVEFHALLLFALETPPVPAPGPGSRERFVLRTREIVAAWSRAREALERAWYATLDTLSLVSTSRTSTRAEAALVRGLARLASELVEPHLLTAVLRSSKSPVALGGLKTQLTQALRVNTPVLLSPHQALIRKQLEQAISADPGALSAALAQVDKLVRDPEFGPEEVKAKLIDGRFAPALARRYGLVRAPRPEIGEVLTAADLRNLTGDVLQGAAGFGAARLPYGLESLITAYRTASHKGDVGQTQRQLLDELIGFAQKVLFVVNFSLLVDANEIRQDGFLLQAVGNAIVTQVDELKHADTAGRRAARRAGADEAVRRRVWEEKQGRGANVIVCDKQDPTKETRDTSDVDAPKRVLDCIITELRYLHLAALKEGGASAPAAKSLQDALDEALKQRARMVQIRPAAAFLRNSYPVTSLQRESAASWSNMLEGHFRRQLNDTGEDPTARRAVQDFDKQFWQNVNTVRVAGAGVTNYVVAKDDVGNWYIKNFSSDPETIIKGAKSLALFAAGGSISADAINRATDKIRSGDATLGSAGTNDGGATQLLQDQRAAADAKDKEQTTALLADIKEVRTPTGLASRVDTAWKSAGVSDAARRELLAVALATSRQQCQSAAPTTPPGEPVLTELRALTSCRDAVLASLEINRLIADIAARTGQVTSDGVKASAKVTAGATAFPTAEGTTAKAKAEAATNAVESATAEAANVVAQSGAPSNAKAAADKAKIALATAMKELSAAQAASTSALSKAQDAAAKFAEANDSATAAAATAKDTHVMTMASTAAVTALGKAKTAVSAAVPMIKRAADLLPEAIASLQSAVGDMDAVVSAFTPTPPNPGAASAATQAQTTVGSAMAKIRSVRDAVQAANNTITGTKQSLDDAVGAIGAIAQAPAPLTPSEVQMAQKGVKDALMNLVLQFSVRRDEILRDHTSRLRAILSE